VVLAVDLPGGLAPTPLPACAVLLNQPCQPTTGTVPAGTLDLGPR
jgi:hypothetical protein